MFPIEEHETVWIDLPDGTKLAARLWLPVGATNASVPAIVEYIPYRRRDRTRVRDESLHRHLAQAGYAALRVDMRGSGDSDGIMEDEYSHQEIQDGVDLIAWIARQPWCNGKVGMFGKSWGAYSAFQVAAKRPPALKAIAPVMGTDDRWLEDIHFYGGVLANDNFWWGAIMQLFNASPPDPAIVGQKRWRQLWKSRLEAMTFWPAQWLAHQTRDAMWRRGSVSENYADINIPVYYFGGWADLYRDTAFRIAEHLKGPVKVLIGPWAHLYPHEATPGPRIDFLAELTHFFDHWLKDQDSGLMDEPAFRCWLQDSIAPAASYAQRPGRWVAETRWPSPNVATQTLWLNDGTLDVEPTTSKTQLAIKSPQTFGAAGGDMFSFATDGDLPMDCRVDAGGALTFRGQPVGSPVEILGQPQVLLAVAADQPQGFVVALLIDEAPDGSQHLITRGFFNLTHRLDDTASTPISVGEVMDVRVALKAIGHSLAIQHRLVVQIASSYWPILWPSPTPVTLTLIAGKSTLQLPIRHTSNTMPLRELAPPTQPSKKPAFTSVSEGELHRDVTIDAITGCYAARTYINGGVFGPVGRIRLDETGTEIGDLSERIYTIHPNDPLSAQASMHQESSFERSDWRVRIKTTAHMTASATDFELTASVTCWDDDHEFHHVDWHHKIRRDGM